MRPWRTGRIGDELTGRRCLDPSGTSINSRIKTRSAGSKLHITAIRAHHTLGTAERVVTRQVALRLRVPLAGLLTLSLLVLWSTGDLGRPFSGLVLAGAATGAVAVGYLSRTTRTLLVAGGGLCVLAALGLAITSSSTPASAECDPSCGISTAGYVLILIVVGFAFVAIGHCARAGFRRVRRRGDYPSQSA